MEGLDQLLEQDETVITCTISLLLDGAAVDTARWLWLGQLLIFQAKNDAYREL